MKCDHCEREALVHELSVQNGVKIERHLCEQCAEQHGISVRPQQPQITDLIKHYVMKQGLTPVVPPVAQPMRANQCPTCKTTYQDFKQHGLLGCADCYKSFEGQLAPIVERFHDGAAAHVGKTPRRGAGSSSEVDDAQARALREHRMERLRVLRHELEQAVREERYEVAARLRDQLRQVEHEPEASHHAKPPGGSQGEGTP